ncbi:MAG: aquaporin Z [Bacteroidales bacterium]|nr:aquaporin Z [Bacteroidales bacterium]
MKTCNKFFAELLGTFVLVFGGCGTAVFAGRAFGFLGVSIAFGLTVIAMAYGIGHISGAHLNPAVSFGVWANGRMTFKDMIIYWVAQIIGAICAAALIYAIVKCGNIEPGNFAANDYGQDLANCGPNYWNINMWGALIVEAVLTFVFLMVILGVTDDRHANGKFAGLAIGLTLVLIHLISIPLTNTSVNPARSISQAIFAGGSALSHLWVFIVAPLVGAGLAGLCYKCLGGCCKSCKKD